jgi:5-(carboxyamino)imidazole ribonucleotide synthase
MNRSLILPGQTIGILGGGQLGRMFTIAARRMGYRVHTLEPAQDSPTGQLADREFNAQYDDVAAAREFAHGVDVVTFEFENVPAPTLAAIAELRPVHPSPTVLDTCRHRLHEKNFLSGHGFACAPYRAVNNATELATAVAELGTPCILKSADFGYDGKGQVRIESGTDLQAAWNSMGRPLGVLEGFVNFQKELSVIVARTAAGESRCYAPFENVHSHHILDITTSPADVSPKTLKEAIDLATAVADQLQLVGVLAVEMFLQNDGKLLVNELAPRPHNSGHLTFDAAITSQFEQQLRAVCGLPLGDPTLLRPAAMANLLGDLWFPNTPNWIAALEDPSVKLHLYGKHAAKPGRKMGHLTAMADTTAAARAIVEKAREALKRATNSE